MAYNSVLLRVKLPQKVIYNVDSPLHMIPVVEMAGSGTMGYMLH